MLNLNALKKYVVMSEEVEGAIRNNKPVVALESTIISHGMPYPENYETALACEDIVRENGAIPATTAIIDGKIRVGLSKEEIEFMATSKDIIKASRRDYPYIVANGLNGATTVATSILTAKLVGIKVLVTGGIGGVHRGAEQTFDISRDLEELANTDIAVVCAGAKSILDIGLTLEYLETAGVPVLGYNTDKMPAFYTRESDFDVDYNIKSYDEMANILRTKWELELDGGALVVNPIPEEHAMDKEIIDSAISGAIEEAKKKNIKGKETTPFLLDEVLKVTEGDSLQANIELVKHNSKIGANIARSLYK